MAIAYTIKNMLMRNRYFLTGFLALIFGQCLAFGQSQLTVALNGQVYTLSSEHLITPATESDKKKLEGVQLAYRDVVKSSIQATLNNGVSEIGGLNLSQLLEKIDSVKIVFLKPGVDVIAVGEFQARMGAANDPVTGTVYLSFDQIDRMIKSDPVRVGPLLTHEFLEATNYQDHRFQLTSVIEATGHMEKSKAILLASKVKKFEWKSPQPLTPKKVMNIRHSSGGGVTVVGGGGDEITLQIKQLMVASYSDWVKDFKEKVYPQIKTQENLKGLENRILADKSFDSFLNFVLLTPIEGMGYDQIAKLGPFDGNIENSVNYLRVYNNEYSACFFRAHRDAWEMAAHGYSLEATRKVKVTMALSELYISFLLGCENK